jgi:hypothetical protein
MEKLFKYNSFIEFRKDYPKECSYLSKNKLISKFCGEMGWSYLSAKPNGYWTKELCIEDALKYEYQQDWRKHSQAAFVASRRIGCYKQCTAHMTPKRKPIGYWTKERCMEEASKHENYTKWKKNNSFSVRMAILNGWYEECTTQLKVKPIKIKKNG